MSQSGVFLQNLPTQLTSFLGRQQEVNEIIDLISQKDCRLLTLTGAGGTGKTRLAIEVAGQIANFFPDGVHYVPLQPLEQGEIAMSTIAYAIGATLHGTGDPLPEVIGYLGDKRLLLVLDNCEHLIQQLDIMNEIIQAAPGVKVLATSREVLNLQSEWLYPVSGLPFPDASSDPSALERYHAVQLFVERARRVQPDFSLAEHETAIARICELVEGLPLAIELAASWVSALSPGEIADEIAHSQDILTSRLRDVPDRHRSIEAVFDQSWAMLSDREREVFKRLSVFRGGFDREAAKAISDASLSMLSALVDKSLLRREADARYQMHELLRQYAEEHLRKSSVEHKATVDAHTIYYAGFLDSRRESIKGGDQRAAVEDMAGELDNVRAAWKRLIDQRRVNELQQGGYTLGYFYDFQARYTEAVDMLQRAVQSIRLAEKSEDQQYALADMLSVLAWARIRVGQAVLARQHWQECESIYEAIGRVPQTGLGTDPQNGLSIVASMEGDYDRALKLAQAAQHNAEQRNDPFNLQLALYRQGEMTLHLGDAQAARDLAQSAYTVALEAEDRWFMAYILNLLGTTDRVLGDSEAAEQHFRVSYSIRESFADSEGMAVALNLLALVTLENGDTGRAADLYNESLAINRRIGDQHGLAISLEGLGHVALTRGEFGLAGSYLREAVQTAMDFEHHLLVLTALVTVGELLIATGHHDRGLSLLAAVLDSRAASQQVRDRAQHIRREAGVSDAGAPPTSGATGLLSIAAGALAELDALVEQPDIAPPPDQSALLDPLTERELEVLGHIADGMTNRQVAEELVITLGTVKWYTSQIYSKLGVESRTQAIARARELGLIA